MFAVGRVRHVVLISVPERSSCSFFPDNAAEQRNIESLKRGSVLRSISVTAVSQPIKRAGGREI